MKLSILLIVILSFSSFSTLNAKEKPKRNCNPLILTPYIESNKISEAKHLSEVKNLPNAPELISYSGFLTVNKQFNSNSFFWFFPSLSNPEKDPVLLYLDGGPGMSSLFGLFNGNGPYIVKQNKYTNELYCRFNNYSWNKKFSMLYIDNPVGTGFSFTQNTKGFAVNQQNVADDLYEALQQFFKLFSEYRNNDFYITGYSYAGKYIPAIGYKLHKNSKISKINFKGIAIGDGWIDPLNMLGFGSFFYQIGLIDENELNHFVLLQNKVKNFILNGNFANAYLIFTEMYLSNISYFQNVTGIKQRFNLLITENPKQFDLYPKYMNMNTTLDSIHAGCLRFSGNNSTVGKYLSEDFCRSEKPSFTILINNYKTLIYNGQLDMTVAIPNTQNFLKNLEWKYSKEFASTKKHVWKVSKSDKEIAGYVKTFGNFTQVIVRNAGHVVFFDQPRAAFDMITKFVRSENFNQI